LGDLDIDFEDESEQTFQKCVVMVRRDSGGWRQRPVAGRYWPGIEPFGRGISYAVEQFWTSQEFYSQ
jgi:hypothetical protein